MSFTDLQIESLYKRVRGEISEYRFSHIAGVERAAIALGELYMPESISELRVAALLHDITKELSTDEHISLMKKHGVAVSENDLRSPKVLHSKTAELAVSERYGEFATERVSEALRYHTTGNAKMTVFDALIYLADYIEDTRTFADCVSLREYFWSAEPQKMTPTQREAHLWQTVLVSLNMTIRDLESSGGYISEETLLAKEAIEKRLS